MKTDIRLKGNSRKIAAIALILHLFVSFLACGPVSAENAADNIKGPNAGGGLSYYEYAEANKDKRLGSAEVEGQLSELVGASSIRLNGASGQAIASKGYAEFSFSVPQEGLYGLYLSYSYKTDSSKSVNLGVSFTVNGASPFNEADFCTLYRAWSDAEKMRTDGIGNDLIPEQKQHEAILVSGISDYSGYLTSPFELYFDEGVNKVRITSLSDDFILFSAALKPKKELKSYSELVADYKAKGHKTIDGGKIHQAENASYKSSQTIYPIYDRSNAATMPSSPRVIKRNTIGGANWNQSGAWISYNIEAEESGLYALSFKFRQNTNMGIASTRNIYINGEIPCEEFSNVDFKYSSAWHNKTITDKNGKPCLVYLKKGENIISLEVTLDKYSDIMLAVDNVSKEMNALYRRIIMVTSANPDLYRDYFLDREIPSLKSELSALADTLGGLASDFDNANGEKSTHSESLRRVSEQLEEFYRNTDEIPARLSAYRNNISILSDWLIAAKAQPLELDYFVLHAPDYKLPSAKGNFIDNIIFSFKRFIAAFSDDYDSMSEYGSGNSEVIEVWLNDGRDQAQIIKNLIFKFTDSTDIPINVNLVQGGLTEAALAGNNPDVAVGVARGQPVNLASRNALEDLSGYEGFNDVKGRFTSDALIPYTWKNGIFALPVTQTYLVMFYRSDILSELGMKVPDTWPELLDAAAMLQRNNMTIGLPYTAITASGAVDLGVGAKDIFPTLLLQYGGNFYNSDITGTALNSEEALSAFKLWTSFYTQYSFELSYDLNTRFRTGEMPIAISSFGMYGTLSAAAPEIRGLWEMAAVPGVKKEGGSIDRSGGASGSAIVMFKNAGNKKNAWEFMRWFTSADTQSAYGSDIENLLGPAARHATANLEAFSRLNWSAEELAVLEAQRDCVLEIPELPGGYYTSRCIDNAFREVLYQNGNARVALENADKTINREIERKREELE